VKRRYLDAEFGSTEEAEFLSRHTFLFVSQSRVVGCVSAVQISSAFKLVPADTTASSGGGTCASAAAPRMVSPKAAAEEDRVIPVPAVATATPISGSDAAHTGAGVAASKAAQSTVAPNGQLSVAGWRCEPTPVTAVLGICHIWVHHQHRRKNIATALVDAARKSLIYGYRVPAHECAFSAPTDMGRRFASAYVGSHSRSHSSSAVDAESDGGCSVLVF